ncbi:IucA/IucC family C-terminal-domain containing protein [Alkalihalobacillus sp. 1P02AB]|uniref:IucA/IucC family C-terminal-domain containing protein n=1 Tax=Alkalihalobacillus sp. 1P02AB TaxID=3132260 RepID=UPI0039A5F14A
MSSINTKEIMDKLEEDLQKNSITIHANMSDGVFISTLFDQQQCKVFLEGEKEELGAPSVSVAASMFSKRYSSLLLNASLTAFMNYNSCIYWPYEACLYTKDRKLELNKNQIRLVSTEMNNREKLREEFLVKLFKENLSPLILNLHEVSRLPLKILWENVSVRMNSIFRKMIEKEQDTCVLNTLSEDFDFLKQSSGKLFGLNENPIAPYLSDEFGEVKTRKTCCLFHKVEKSLEPNKYCNVCPLNR